MNPGASATLTAQAGCGKTTFLLQLLEHLNQAGYDVAYASGEENCFQLAFTCKRLDVKGVSIANVTDVDTIAEAMEGVDVMVVRELTGDVYFGSPKGIDVVDG